MLEAAGLSKVFPGGAKGLDDVSFTVSPGEVLTLLGPSGCGKSTLLRIVAGLETPTSGTLRLDGVDLATVPAGRRDVGFVFQSYALYPHLTVSGNLSLALKVRGTPSDQITKRVGETADMLGLSDLLERRPAQLSGGQQQRVALGRALVRRPRLFLLDEPLSNLDALLREGMRGELRGLFRRLDATVMYVTHDQAEAMSLSDRVMVLRDGRVLQVATPLDLYARPLDVFTATFVGSPRLTIWEGTTREGRFFGKEINVALPSGISATGAVSLGIRPEHVHVSTERSADSMEAHIEFAEPTGERVLLTLAVGGERLRAFAGAATWPERVHVTLALEHLHVFDASSGTRVKILPTH